MKEFLESVAAGLQSQCTGADAFEYRLSLVATVGCSGMSLLSHEPGLQPSQKRAAEDELFRTLRALNLATWAMSACETLATHAALVEGVCVFDSIVWKGVRI